MRLALTVLLFLLSSASAAFSCSCISSGGCPGLGGQKHPVFLGTVLSVTDLPRTDGFVFLSSRKARMRVDEPFGGLPTDLYEVEIYTGSGGGDCGIAFKAGEKYLIDAFIGEDGLAHAGICSSTRRVDGAGVSLQLLRQQRDGKQLPSLIGQVAQVDRNFDGLLGTHDPKPLPSLLVRVTVNGTAYETQADATGFYAFYDLPPGKYQFVPDLPPGTTLSWFIGSDEPLAPFDLPAHACEAHNIEVFASGSIQGRILDSSDKPLKSAFAYIVPAHEKALPKKSQLYWEYQGKEDFFKFVHLPPGEYLIVVNPEDSLNPEFPYRRTFYPGVPDRASASIITILGGEQIKDADIRLVQQFAPRHATVRVTWADGSLIRDFVLVAAIGTANPAAMSHTSQPDLKASVVDLTVVPDEPYDVEANLTCRYADEKSVGPGKKLKSGRVHLDPGDDQKEIMLKLPVNSCPEVPGKKLITGQ
jgi:hypothetical protein